MTSSNRSTLWHFYLPCRQLSKLVDCQVNLNGERARGPLGCRQCQKCVSFKVSEGCQEQRSPPESDNAWDGEDWCLRGLLRGQQSVRQVSVCERTQSVCASPRVVTLGSVWGKTWVHVLPCSVWMWIPYMDAARRQDCVYFAANKLLHKKCRVKPRGRESKSIPNRNKTKSLVL